MIVKASGSSALILAAALWATCAGPSHAAASADSAAASSKSGGTAGAPIALDKYVKHASRRGKSSAHRKSVDLAQKSTAATKAATADPANKDDNHPSAISPSIANANAQLAASEAPTGDDKAVLRQPNDAPASPANPAESQSAAETQVVSSDQLNDVDRALSESSLPATPLRMASVEAPVASAAAPVASAMADSTDSSAWERTSLIGKVFIGFGALLTMASAARMFMA